MKRETITTGRFIREMDQAPLSIKKKESRGIIGFLKSFMQHSHMWTEKDSAGIVVGFATTVGFVVIVATLVLAMTKYSDIALTVPLFGSPSLLVVLMLVIVAMRTGIVAEGNNRGVFYIHLFGHLLVVLGLFFRFESFPIILIPLISFSILFSMYLLGGIRGMRQSSPLIDSGQNVKVFPSAVIQEVEECLRPLEERFKEAGI